MGLFIVMAGEVVQRRGAQFPVARQRKSGKQLWRRKLVVTRSRAPEPAPTTGADDKRLAGRASELRRNNAGDRADYDLAVHRERCRVPS